MISITYCIHVTNTNIYYFHEQICMHMRDSAIKQTRQPLSQGFLNGPYRLNVKNIHTLHQYRFITNTPVKLDTLFEHI